MHGHLRPGDGGDHGSEGFPARVAGPANGAQVRTGFERDRRGASARGLALRAGLGKAKHMAIKYLWTQQLLKDKALKLNYVKSETNTGEHRISDNNSPRTRPESTKGTSRHR